MKKGRIIYAIIFATILFTSCNNHSIKLKDELGKSYTYDGKTIELTGIFEAPFIARSGTNMDMDLVVYNDYYLIQTGNTEISGIELSYGEGKNSVVINVPEGETNFKSTDVVLYDKDGNKFTTDDKVKISGLVTYTAKGPKAKSTVTDFNTGKSKEEETSNDYRYKITNVLIEKK